MATDRTATSFMPEDVTQPFFAYGIFKPGEIAFFQIKRLEPISVEQTEVIGALRGRDGVLLLLETPTGSPIRGWRITFKPGVEAGTAAYQAIGAMEPRAQYRWGSHDGMNVLYARSPNKGSEETAEHLWRGSWDDGAFVHALRLVEESVSETEGGPLAFYKLQSAHLLLWSSIERYASLRYGLGANTNVVARVAKLAEESAFIDSLQPSAILEERGLVRTDDPAGNLLRYDSTDPNNALNYLYRIRNNVAHRGKEMGPDETLLRTATAETLRIFKCCLRAAEAESRPDS